MVKLAMPSAAAAKLLAAQVRGKNFIAVNVAVAQDIRISVFNGEKRCILVTQKDGDQMK